MTDNVVSVSFKEESDIDTLIKEMSKLDLDRIVFVARKDDQILVGTSNLPDIGAAPGDLVLAQHYIALEGLA